VPTTEKKLTVAATHTVVKCEANEFGRSMVAIKDETLDIFLGG